MSGKEKNSKSTWIDPDDAPEWTDDQFARAQLSIGGRVIRPARGTLTEPGPPQILEPYRRGRPRLAAPKKQVTLRLDHDVVERFRASGPGWQSRINDILRKAVGG
ncbi:MAG TPA: BrnA antitoxin family protein [Caulobacteraceae bacterium]